MAKQSSNPLVSDRLSYLWLIIAAILLVFTYGMYRNTLAAVLAFIFLLRFMRSRRTGVGYVLAAAALVLANTIAWWNTDTSLPIIGRIIFGLVAGVLYSPALLLDRVLVRKFHGFSSTLIFPVLNTGLEFLLMWPNPLTTQGSLAYSQYGAPALAQITSITGLWGLTFIVSWIASTVNWIWAEGMNWTRIRRGLAAFAGVLFVVVAFGAVRLSYSLPQSGTVRIHGIVETDYTREDWNTRILPLSTTNPDQFRAITQPIFKRYLDATTREAQAGGQIIAWPELAIEGMAEDVDATVKAAQDIARQEGVYLAIGTGVVLPSDPARPYLDANKLLIIGPKGDILVDQVKYGCGSNRIYSFDIPTIDTPYGKLAGVVCCDLEYPLVVRQVSQKGVDILVVPSFEPTRANLISHSLMTPFRSIENGVSIFRTTAQGLSWAIDPYGRVIGSMDATTANEKVLVSQLPNHHIFTVYSVVGELFGWLNVAGMIFIIAWAVIRRRKPVNEDISNAAN